MGGGPATGSERTDASTRLARLDGLRGCAAVSVVLAHALIFLPGGATGDRVGARIGLTGVALFFAMSGYLLYRPFVTARNSGRRLPSVRRFAIRRALRIFPAYWVALTLLAVWPGLVGVLSGDWWLYYGLLQVYDLEAATTGGLGPAWTLCVDLTFYLLLPAIAWVVATRPPGAARRVEIAILAAGAAGALAFRAAVGDDRETFNWTQTLLATFGWFAVGMLLASAQAGAAVDAAGRVVKAVLSRPGRCLAVAGCVQIALFGLELAYVRPSLEVVAEFVGHGLVAGLVLVAAVSSLKMPRSGPLGLSGRPAAALSKMSYGMYLWHAPVAAHFSQSRLADAPGGGIVFLAAVLFASALCGAISYVAIERPLLESRWYVGRPRAAGWETPPP